MGDPVPHHDKASIGIMREHAPSTQLGNTVPWSMYVGRYLYVFARLVTVLERSRGTHIGLGGICYDISQESQGLTWIEPLRDVIWCDAYGCGVAFMHMDFLITPRHMMSHIF